MEFRMLGPLEVTERGRLVPLGGSKQRAILAHLLIQANQVVSTDRLIDEVWGEESPEAVRKSLQAYVSRLKKSLADESRIESRSSGYVLHADPDEVDAQRFEILLREARGTADGDPEAALEKVTEALGLWRGPPLADLAEERSLRGEIARLEETRMQAVEQRISCQLALGHHAEVIGELEAEVDRHPLRERLWGHLMVALYRAGRQGEALDAFQRALHVLATELGIDPSAELRELQARLLRQDLAPEPEGTRLRGYRILEQIGEGGFGVVYRADQPHVGREVAVKVIRPELANDPEFIRRFEAEAQMVARLEHPHIVPLYDYWREPDAAYLVMRWLRGGSLRGKLAGRPLEPDEAAGLVDQVASALTAAHRQGVVHRDVKPGNILLDEEGNAYLSDFGIARDVIVAEQVVPTSPDTTGYLSPEQIRGGPATSRSDIYGLGVIIYEALTGHHPFPDAPADELKRQHLERRLPSVRDQRDVPAVVDAVIERATAKDPAERFADAAALATALRRALGEARAPVSAPDIPNPYKGLLPFQEADAADFFGREALTDRLLSRLAEPEPGFLAVVGPSGSGKSSVVRAGLIPALRRGVVQGSESWFVAEMRPGADPIRELETALMRIAVEPPFGLLDQLEREEGGLLRAVGLVLPVASKVLLFVDQFEEVFTLVADEGRRRRFLASLVAAATEPSHRVRVVATLRADFYDRPLRYRSLGELIRTGSELVLPLSSDELERAITNPAERVGVSAEPGLVPEIVSHVADQPGSLPLLQYTLTELFARRKDGALTLDGYHRIGGVSGALVRRAEEIYRSLDDGGRAASRELFLRLVTLGEDTQGTRRRVPQTQVVSLEKHGGSIARVMDAFGRHRLLSFDRDPDSREPTVEVAHEALLTAWGRLQGWVDSAREDLRMHRRLAAAGGEWTVAGRDPSFLLRGGRLDQIESWAATSGLALARSEREYLETSIAAREAERAGEEARREKETALQRRSINRLRALVSVLTAAGLVAGGLTFLAFDQRQEARDQAARAEREARVAVARELASAAAASLSEDPERAILLALEAVEATRALDGDVLKEAEEALHSAVQASRVVSSFSGLFGLQFSPDGTRIATSHEDGSARIWDPLTGEELLALTGHAARTMSVDWTADGRLLASSSEDGTAKLWDAETGEDLRSFVGHETGLRSPHFSPDDTILATTSFDGTTRLWDVATGEQLQVLNHTGGVEFSPDGTRLVVSDPPITVYDLSTGKAVLRVGKQISDPRDATWSGDGRRIAVADADGFGHVFDARSGARLLTLVGHNERSTVGEIVFSSDDALLATASSDGTVRVWDADSGREVLVLPGLGGNVEGVDFSPDGTLVAGSSGSGAAKVWDITDAGSRELLTIPGHADIVWGMGFGEGGSWLATGSVDGTAGIWDAETAEELVQLAGFDRARVEDLAVSPDGTRVIGTGGDGTVMLWDSATGTVVRELQRGGAASLGARFSPDGRRVVTGDVEGNATVWEAETGKQLVVIDAHDREIFAVAFSPDGERIATGGVDEAAKVWDADSGVMLAHMVRHQDNINATAFSPDGSRLFTAGEDGVLKVWDAATGRELRAISGHAAGLMDVVFSPDGTRIATAGRDGTTRLWDPETGQELLVLAGHRSGVSAVAFSPEGSRLAAAGEDGTIRLYTLSIEELIELANDRVTRSLTDQECRQYLHVDACPRDA